MNVSFYECKMYWHATSECRRRLWYHGFPWWTFGNLPVGHSVKTCTVQPFSGVGARCKLQA